MSSGRKWRGVKFGGHERQWGLCRLFKAVKINEFQGLLIQPSADAGLAVRDPASLVPKHLGRSEPAALRARLPPSRPLVRPSGATDLPAQVDGGVVQRRLKIGLD